MSVKSPSVGRRKRAATRQDQTDTIKSRLKAAAGGRKRAQSVLVVDVGGTSVKILATGQSESRSFLIRTKAHSQTDGRKGYEACRGLDV